MNEGTKGTAMARNRWGKSNHGAEPWRVSEVTGGTDRGRNKSLCIFDADDDIVLTVCTVRSGDEFPPRERDNATRIVECVNWCRQ